MARQCFPHGHLSGLSPFPEGDQQFACWLLFFVVCLRCDCETSRVAFAGSRSSGSQFNVMTGTVKSEENLSESVTIHQKA